MNLGTAGNQLNSGGISVKMKLKLGQRDRKRLGSKQNY